MSPLLAQDVPLPQSHASPAPTDDSSPGTDGQTDTHTVQALVETVASKCPAESESNEQPAATPLGVEPLHQDSDSAGGQSTSADGQQRSASPSAAAKVTSPSISNPALRPGTPSSRNSTPPLAGVTATKKFSSVNVNKKFLSKTATPATGSPAAGAKSGLSSSSPIPVAQTSRLLSTKLTTVPFSKPSTSPLPPGSASSSANASPWAKPAAPLGDSSGGAGPGLHQPQPSRARLVSTATVAMGAGQGIGSGPKQAWRPLASDGPKSTLGLSRDFPTAKEVADGKRDAQAAAQAKAAHNQAILQGLNAFTHQLETNTHRWEDEDDDDEVMDFGDGHVYHTHHFESHLQQDDQPVAKLDRFVDDFDRSWPRQRLVETEPSTESRRADIDRVLFNASSNRLETNNSRQTTSTTQPTRLVSRNEPPSRSLDRPLPPHIQSGADNSSRMLPPHMASSTAGPTPTPRAPLSNAPSHPPAGVSSGRTPWSLQRDTERAPPPPLAPHHQPTQLSPSEAPQHQSFSHAQRPSINSLEEASPIQPAVVPPGVDNQAAEMHSAAEKARLRRLAEEQEREAAAERARRKAKELEERLGLKDRAPSSSEHASLATHSAVPTAKPSVSGLTLAQRPQPAEDSPQKPTSAFTLPARPAHESRNGDVGSWRARSIVSQHPSDPSTRLAVDVEAHKTPSGHSRDLPVHTAISPSRTEDNLAAAAESPSLLERTPRKEHNFDNMLARIQAAMAQARAAPSPPAQTVDLPDFTPGEISPPERRSEIIQQSNPEKLKPAPAPLKVVVELPVTQLEIPPSPPPAWRTYTVKLPKVNGVGGPTASLKQVKAFEQYIHIPPNGWPLSFEPPMDGLNPATLSQSEALLPQPVQRRFGKHVESGPVVSISPRRLEPYQKPKRTGTEEHTTPSSHHDFNPKVPSAESLLPETSLFQTAEPAERWTDRSAAMPEPARKTRSPVKTSLAAKAERAGAFAVDGVDGVGIRPAHRERADSDLKPGVRFMVSSELEGDSLLQEINKISLDSVGEGLDDKNANVGGDAVSKPSSGVESAPKTPPTLGSSAFGSSPNGPASPWPKTTASRSTTQHDHLKSVWDHAPSAAEQPGSTSNKSAAVDVSTPLYPTLNAPSPADPPTKTLGQNVKSPYTSSRAFSPNAQPFTSHQSPVQYGFNPDASGAAAGGYVRNPNNGSINGGYGMQQAVWSPSAFGTGYGYSKPGVGGMDQQHNKAAMAFNNAGVSGKDMYGGGGDFRYGHNASSYGQGQGYGGGYGRPRSLASQQTTMYGYYGAPGQGSGAGGGRGRFGSPSGDFGNHGAIDGGYYGGVAPNYGYGQGPPGQGHGGHGQSFGGQGQGGHGHGQHPGSHQAHSLQHGLGAIGQQGQGQGQGRPQVNASLNAGGAQATKIATTAGNGPAAASANSSANASVDINAAATANNSNKTPHANQAAAVASGDGHRQVW